MLKIKVEYQAGESRYSKKGVDYMLAIVDNNIELYAEVDSTEESYEILKEMILEQADGKGIDVKILEFFYD